MYVPMTIPTTRRLAPMSPWTERAAAEATEAVAVAHEPNLPAGR